MHKIIYSIRNFVWYWKARKISQESYDRIYARRDNPGEAITELLLNTVGLTISANGGELDGIYLTDIQKHVVANAAEWGYYVRVLGKDN